MDKFLSIASAIVIPAMMLGMAWLFSGGLDWIQWRQRPLGEVVTLLGGPLGIWGGILLAAAVGVASYGLHELCNVWSGRWFVRSLERRGRTPDEIADRIAALPVSAALKARMMAARRLAPAAPTPPQT